MDAEDPRRAITSVGELLLDPRIVSAITRLDRSLVKKAVAEAAGLARLGRLDSSQIVALALSRLPRASSSFSSVLNGTGVVLHTNLGRASLSASAIDAILNATAYVDLEYKLDTGERTPRARNTVLALLEAIPDADDALVVNNGAAALLLACCALSRAKQVVISRGEMVEIGAGFRLPDLIRSLGIEICEVGTTNRTAIDDYRAGISMGGDTIVKIHPSNFHLSGFTSAVGVSELAALGLPLIVDIGSGLLRPDRLIPDEPNVADTLIAGATVVTFSADKLLGGPQAGILAGRSDAMSKIRAHPLSRAMRIDKLTAAALEATLRGPSTPTYEYIHADSESLLRRCQYIAASTGTDVVPSVGAIGGGSAPDARLDGWAVALPERFARLLRMGEPPIIGRLERGYLLVDPRCIPVEKDAELIDSISRAMRDPSCT